MKRIYLVIAAVGSCNAFAQETPMSIGAMNCAEHIARKVSFNRPETVSVGEPTGGRVEMFRYHGQSIPARKFTVPANGRNWTCITSEDGRRILQSS